MQYLKGFKKIAKYSKIQILKNMVLKLRTMLENYDKDAPNVERRQIKHLIDQIDQLSSEFPIAEYLTLYGLEKLKLYAGSIGLEEIEENFDAKMATGVANSMLDDIDEYIEEWT